MRQYFSESKSPFHIYSRGVDKRVVFCNDHDRMRFVLLMYISSRGKPLYLTRKNIAPSFHSLMRGAGPDKSLYIEEHESLVSFVSWALMPNHFRFLIASNCDGGISKYMQKLITAYTKYFNKLYERNGSLFQSSFQSKEVSDPEYLYHLSRYIHLNPAELKEDKWKERGVRDWKAMKEFLSVYKWSSYPEFIGARKANTVNRELIAELFNEKFGPRRGLSGYQKFTEQWLGKDLPFIEGYTLE